MPFDEAKQVFAENLEYHADVRAIWPLVFKVVKEGYNVRSARMSLGRGRCWVRVLRSALDRGGGGCDETL